MSASHQAISYVNDLSASAQAQLNALREGSATANNAVSAQFAHSASKATVIASLSGTYSVAAENVPSLAGISNTFVGVVSGLAGPIVVKATVPGIVIYQSNATADEGVWQIAAENGVLNFRTVTDAGTANNWFRAIRSGASIADISISCSALYVNGFSVLSPPALNGVAAASYARLDVAQTFAKGAGSTIVALTDGSTISPNCEDGNVFRVVLGGNRSMAAPSNARSGQTIVFHILQDGSGGRTLSWNTIYKFAGSTDPTLSTGANDVDVFAFNFDSVSGVWRQAGLNVG